MTRFSDPAPDPVRCETCVFGQRQMLGGDLQKRRVCGRYPPTIPMPAGPQGQGIMFMQPFVADEGSCGEWAPLVSS